MESEIEYTSWLGDFSTPQYESAAESYATLFDEEFEKVAQDFRMTMTGLYVKFESTDELRNVDLIIY